MSESPPPQPGYTRLVADLPNTTADQLRYIAGTLGQNVNDTLQQIIENEYYLRQQQSSGSTLVLEKPGGARSVVRYKTRE